MWSKRRTRHQDNTTPSGSRCVRQGDAIYAQQVSKYSRSRDDARGKILSNFGQTFGRFVHSHRRGIALF